MPRSSWVRDRLEWLRAADLRLLAELAAIALLIVAFVWIGSAIGELDPGAFDRAILLALRHAPDDPIGSRDVEVAVMHLSALGSGAVTTLIVLIAIAFFALAGRWRYALLVAACALGTLLAMELLKSLYARSRPTVVTQLDPPGGLSFPSGHSMISAALYLTLGVLIARAMPTRRLRVFAIATAAFLAILVGLSRIYLGVHYPTDVLGGWTAGLTWALICGVAVRHLGKRRAGGVPETGDD